MLEAQDYMAQVTLHSVALAPSPFVLNLFWRCTALRGAVWLLVMVHRRSEEAALRRRMRAMQLGYAARVGRRSRSGHQFAPLASSE